MPGFGALTVELAKRARKVVAVELDSDVIPSLKGNLEGFDNVTVLEGDIMKMDLAEIIREHFPGMKVAVAGLVTDVKTLMTKNGKPYSRTTLEDYSGSYELSLFGKDHENFLSYLVPHSGLFLEGEIDTKFFVKPEDASQGKSSPYVFKLKKITLLGNVADSLLSAFSLNCNLASAFVPDLPSTPVSTKMVPSDST